MHFITKSFKELTIDELYELLQLRIEVFVVEQTCYYQDLDDKDRHPGAQHLLGYHDGRLAGYLRTLPRGVSYPEYQSIGRVVTSDAVRGQGTGHQLLEEGVALCLAQDAELAIKISAQEHLQGYYGRQGFVTVSDVYLEDGIDHVAMVRAPQQLISQ
ncbi:GNAT family N-acetyltransferase [Shewanella sp. YLB-07]|uniref:GNAT family N-acetyltransferase n=1 Tax=Shewanella sp. YLB-07 TaxID=2601268 RepID=UPI00128BC8AC|nr:GNAT family N-acetyltransferase [Shewanella sp. YLB-07]MPY25970.1 GNAT family N-acetyltransferase [Shewanella sp. YLB-07]